MNTTAPQIKRIPEWTFGDRVRKARIETGLDQKEFAKELGIKAPTLASYEAGNSQPRSKDLLKLATALEHLTGIDRLWFVGWADNGPGGGTESPLPYSKRRPSAYKTDISNIVRMFPKLGSGAAIAA